MNTAVKVWFHRARAAAWVLVGLVSFPLGWANSVAVVWIASVYANALTDWGASEAADDRTVVDALERITDQLDRLERRIDRFDPDHLDTHHRPEGDAR